MSSLQKELLLVPFRHGEQSNRIDGAMELSCTNPKAVCPFNPFRFSVDGRIWIFWRSAGSRELVLNKRKKLRASNTSSIGTRL